MMGLTFFRQLVLGLAKTYHISVISIPVTDNDAVYNAYLTFAKTPEYFGRVDDENNSELQKAHLSWQRNGRYYYVKKEAKDAFRDLIVQAAVSGKTVEVDAAKMVKIEDVKEITGQPGYEPVADRGQHFLSLTFNKKVKNFDGTLTLILEGDLERVFQVLPVGTVNIGEDTDQLVLFYSELDISKGHNIPVAELTFKLVGATVSLRLRSLKAPPVSTDAIDAGRSLKLQQQLLQQERARPQRR
jgi:hypothetical protein